ncbi:MAG: NADH-quinone oxidoreductase subunit NuoH [Egibacteraceae bacterium]
MDWIGFLITVLVAVGAFALWLGGTAILIWGERRIVAKMQSRIGPNRLGPFGLLQTIADGAKLFFKEDVTPSNVDKVVYLAAPIVSAVVALLTFAVIPYGGTFTVGGREVTLQVWDPNIGLLWVLAMGSIGVYGIVLAGWSSNNKYALLGGMRASAQMISYEIAMGMSTVAVLLLSGNVTLSEVVAKQQGSLLQWNVFPLTLAYFIFTVAAFAETNRVPFDLPEAEGELVAGYHSEYSSMKFSMFIIAEYSNMVTASALMATFFFGGWDIPFWARDNQAPWTWWLSALTGLSFFLKTSFFIFLYVWVRWTLPRFRYDQLMALGWKIMLPLALVYLMVIATAIWYLHDRLGWDYDGRFAGVLFAVNLALAVPLFFMLDRGRLVSGSMEGGQA